MGRNEGYRHEETLGPEAAGRTVLDWLASEYRHSSRETWSERIRAGEVELDDRIASADEVLRRGQVLVWNRPPWTEPAAPLHFDVLHEDRDVLVVSKPSGLPTMAGGGFLQHTLQAIVERAFPGTRPIHRLGRGTSGVVIFARSSAAASFLSAELRERRIRRVYLALASGDPAWDERTIDVPIGPVEHPRLGSIHAASPGGKPALSRARVVERRGATTLIEVEIETGRPHQIRIHLAAVGHPLAGDPLYEAGGLPSPSALPGDLGYLLHARRVEFTHLSGHRLAVESEPPEPLRPRP